MSKTTGFLVYDGTIRLKLDVDLLESNTGLTLDHADNIAKLSRSLTIDSQDYDIESRNIDIKVIVESLYSDNLSLGIPENAFGKVLGDITVGLISSRKSTFHR